MRVEQLSNFLLKGSKRTLAALILAGLVSGACSAGLVAMINVLLHESGGATQAVALVFVTLAIAKIVTHGLAQLLLVYFAQNTILNLGINLCDKVIRAPLRTLEKSGQSHILAVLTDDISAVAWALQSVPNLIINGAVLLGCVAYLAWLSWTILLGVLCLAGIGALVYKVLHDRAFKVIYQARESRAMLFRHFRGLIEGVKELMMHRGRREAFLSEDIAQTGGALRRLNLEATKQYIFADSWTQGLFYTLIGVVLLVLPGLFVMSAESLTGYAFAMFFMMNPMWAVIGTLPTLARGQVALEKIEELGVSLDSLRPMPNLREYTPQSGLDGASVDLEDMTFSYADNTIGDHPFSLGPISFHLGSGDLVFIVGGNGSGKSTFVKLLVGLYAQKSGAIHLGGQPITEHNRDWYRQHFSVVFSDFYLFEKLFGLDQKHDEARIEKYLSRLEIADKVRVIGHRLSTTDVSQGQRRRLALLTAYLEDRPFYVFDEWAADQDPEYKEVFYTELLPELRARGKGIAVITHDDRYFHLGDRIIKLDDGKIVEIRDKTAAGGRSLRSAPGQV